MADLPKTSPPAPFRLGGLEVHPASNEIRGPRGLERVRPLLMRILVRLAAEPGAVVRRETLLEDVWPRRMVNDEVLSRAIAELRTALGDDARGARYVETLPKAGYRLVAAVTPLEAPPATAPLPAPRAGRPWVIATAVAGLAAIAGVVAWVARVPAPAPGLEARVAAARPLTSDPAFELSPRFSPDGERVAFAAGVPGESRIVVQKLDGSERRELGERGWVHHSPVFLPDGRRIVAWRGRAKDGACGLVELSPDSPAGREILDCRLKPSPRFDVSRDGRLAAFTGHGRAGFPAGLWVLPLAGGEPRALTTPEPGLGDDAFPRFSPDGARVAFFRGSESHRRLWIVPVDAPAGARAASAHEGLAYGAAWLGREGPLLVAADWLGFRALVTLDPATGRAALVGARGARFPDASDAGDLVWEHAVYTANLWLLDPAAPGGRRALWPSTRYTSQPEFSPDGRALAFGSNREGADAIYVAELDGSAPRRIAFDEAHRYLRPHWSADGRAVHAVRITARADGSSAQEAVRLPLDGREEVLAALGRAVADVRETRDGRHLLWGEAAGASMRLMRAPVDRPEAAERLPVPAAAQFHANRTHIVIAQPQLPRLVACRLADLACAPMELDVPEADLFHWSLTDRSVWVRARDGREAWLEQREFPSGRRLARHDVVPGGAGTSIAASPDDSRVVVVREEGPTVDLMVARR